MTDESCEVWVPLSIYELSFGSCLNAYWSCASPDKSEAWDRIIDWYAAAASSGTPECRKVFALPEKRSAAIAALRRKGMRLEKATITLAFAAKFSG